MNKEQSEALEGVKGVDDTYYNYHGNSTQKIIISECSEIAQIFYLVHLQDQVTVLDLISSKQKIQLNERCTVGERCTAGIIIPQP